MSIYYILRLLAGGIIPIYVLLEMLGGQLHSLPVCILCFIISFIALYPTGLYMIIQHFTTRTNV